MHSILISDKETDLNNIAYSLPWNIGATLHNFKSPTECILKSEIETINDKTEIITIVINCDLEDYSFLNDFKNLRQLYIYKGKHLDNLNFIEDKYFLDHLYISESNITSIESLEKLVKAKRKLCREASDLTLKLKYKSPSVYLNTSYERLKFFKLTQLDGCFSELWINNKSYIVR